MAKPVVVMRGRKTQVNEIDLGIPSANAQKKSLIQSQKEVLQLRLRVREQEGLYNNLKHDQEKLKE